MTTDTGTCPECHSGFTVSRYGRQIPCPHCGELLDIRPDHPMSGNGRGRSIDWRKAFKGEIDYLAALRDEVTLLGIAEDVAGAAEYIDALLGRIDVLTRKMHGHEM